MQQREAASRHSALDATDPAPTADAVSPNDSDAVNWAALQKDDPYIGEVYQLIANQLPRPSPETISHLSAETKTLFQQYEQLSITTDGILCRSYPSMTPGLSYQQIVVPRPLRVEVADNLHRGLNGGHLGNRRSKALLRKHFYWPGWSADVRAAKLRCRQCARYHRPRPQRQGHLQPLLTGEPWERLGIDVTGPHPPSSRGNRYILTMIDHFTKWVEIFPMKNQEATTMAKILVDKVFSTHGCPLQILTIGVPISKVHYSKSSVSSCPSTKYAPPPTNRRPTATSRGFTERCTLCWRNS